MGICGSSLTAEQKKGLMTSRELEAAHSRAQVEESRLVRLLLLGAGESGKSTIFKQMKILYGNGFEDQDLKTSIEPIHENTIVFMKALCEAVSLLSYESELKNREAFDRILSIGQEENSRIDAQRAEDIKVLWQDPACKAAWKRRNEFQIVESNKSFIEDIDRISTENYTPTTKDILLSRVRTIGIHEESYMIEKVNFVIIDVGGQRNERRKWLHCFDNVTAIIFVAALSEYDQVLFEDEDTNRMVEAINLFKEQVNNPIFAHLDFMLFLNKKDLFAEKLLSNPISKVEAFSDYTGKEGDFQEGADYFKAKFDAVNKGKNRDIFTHVTCATDTNNIQFVFDACKTIILKGIFDDGGFISK